MIKTSEEHEIAICTRKGLFFAKLKQVDPDHYEYIEEH